MYILRRTRLIPKKEKERQPEGGVKRKTPMTRGREGTKKVVSAVFDTSALDQRSRGLKKGGWGMGNFLQPPERKRRHISSGGRITPDQGPVIETTRSR